MSSKNTIGNEVSVDEQGFEPVERSGVEDDGEVVDEQQPLRPTVEQEVQAKVDANHPDATPHGLTLAAEERLEARELEIERTRVRLDRRSDSDREARTRTRAAQGSIERRRRFGKRAASVNPRAAPNAVDPRAQLSRSELGAVNEETARLAADLDGWTTAAISRRLAERVADGIDVVSAVVGVHEELELARGHVIPIGAVEEVGRPEVSVEGRVKVLWEPSHPAISQVGLLEDDSGTIKFTSWKRSRQPVVEEGGLVRVRHAAVSWYQGRPSIALTGHSQVHFPERAARRV
jgi:hypothetical protein